jgi:AraC-like DNA-binding protein
VVPVGFQPPVGMPSGVEVLSLSQLYARGKSDSPIARPQRPTFHHLIGVKNGQLAHTVDFTELVVPASGWLWIRPGQVQQWHERGTADGPVILFESGFVDPTTLALAHVDDVLPCAVLVPQAGEAAVLTMASDHLVREFNGPLIRPVEAQVAILRQLLGVLLIRLSHLAATNRAPTQSETDAFVAFRDAVEARFTHTRRVGDYACLLGYSARTLSRAAEDAAGVGAKQFIDRRIVLEAKRLLAHTDLPAATIAKSLGLSSATNFSKYFRQRTGQTPLEFRRAIRGTA